MNTTPCLTDFANGADAREMLAGDAEPVSASVMRAIKASGTLVGVNYTDERAVYRHDEMLYIYEVGDEGDEGDMVPCALEIPTSSCVIYLGNNVSTFLCGERDSSAPPLPEVIGAAIGLLVKAPCAGKVEIATEMIYAAISGGGDGRRGKVAAALELMFVDTDDDGDLIRELHGVVIPLVLREATHLNLCTGFRFNGLMQLELSLGAFCFETKQVPACAAAGKVLIDAYGAYVATHGGAGPARVAGKTYASVRVSATKWILEGPNFPGAPGKQITTVTKNDDGEYIDVNGDEIETGRYEGNFCPPTACAVWAASEAAMSASLAAAAKGRSERKREREERTDAAPAPAPNSRGAKRRCP